MYWLSSQSFIVHIMHIKSSCFVSLEVFKVTRDFLMDHKTLPAKFTDSFISKDEDFFNSSTFKARKFQHAI